jgi:hypothetical protein
MAKAEINSGICGMNTTVETRMNGSKCQVHIQSDCKGIRKIGEELIEVDPFREFSYRRDFPLTFELAAKYCSHAACPVPPGIIKAIEIEAGLALPADVTIKLSKSDE